MKQKEYQSEASSMEATTDFAETIQPISAGSSLMLSDQQLASLNLLGDDLLMMGRELEILSEVTISDAQLEELTACYGSRESVTKSETRRLRKQAFSDIVIRCFGSLENQLLIEYPAERVRAAAVRKCLCKAAQASVDDLLKVHPEQSAAVKFFLISMNRQYKNARHTRWREKLADIVLSIYSLHMFHYVRGENDNLLPISTNNECLCSAVDLTIAKMKNLSPEKFIPEKGGFSNFFLKSLKHHYSDELKRYWESKRFGGFSGGGRDDEHEEDESPEPSFKATPDWVASLTNEDGEEIAVPDLLWSGCDNVSSEEEMLDRIAVNQQLTAMILNYESLLNRRPPATAPKDAKETLRLFAMWYSEISVLMLKLGLPIWNQQDTQRALVFSYLDRFLKEDFKIEQNQTLDLVRNSEILPIYQPRIRPDPVHVEWKQSGFLPTVIPQDHILETWSEEDRRKWSAHGYPSDSTITTSRQKYVSWFHQLMCDD